jgi:nicotinate-nucleotide--dimethylbenzimidazole phosphoribosyltransferase
MSVSVEELVAAIRPLDEKALEAARLRQEKLAVPPGSLGKLQDAAVRLAGITGKLHNEITRCRVIVMAADNGIIEEGIGSAPRTVTAAQAANMTHYLTGMSSIAHYFGDQVRVVDLGIADPYDAPQIIDRRIAPGTKNFMYEPAMTREQAVEAILVGEEMAKKAHEEGVSVIGVGEMGIGNTTTSAAVLCALTGLPVESVTGRGGGITDAGFEKKKRVIRDGLALNCPDPADPVDVLAKVGGLDLCAMCGVFLGAAAMRLPVVIDGLISASAALCARRLCPGSAEFMFPSHASYEIGYRIAAEELGISPWLQLDMRLGEGSGCPIAFRIIEAACAFTANMASFDEAAIDDSYLDEIRGKDCFSV